MLEEAKQQCDYLIAALQTDPTIDRPEKNKPSQTVVERYIQLKGCKFVDEIVPYTTEQDLDFFEYLSASNLDNPNDILLTMDKFKRTCYKSQNCTKFIF
jgi:glycerol-3-phosphate cytidylyltransferase-like family protein